MDPIVIERVVVGPEVVGAGLTVPLEGNPPGAAAVGVLGEVNTCHPGSVLGADSAVGQPLVDRADDGVVLVQPGATHAGQGVNAREFLGEAQQITLEFDGAVPILEGEGGAPHRPEVRDEEVFGEQVLDAPGPDGRLRHGEQP
jgi:hypothetical protein